MEQTNETKSISEHHEKKSNPWMFASIILGVAVIVLFGIILVNGGLTGKVVAGETAGNDLVKYLNEKTGGGVEYVSYSDKGNLYEVNVKYQNQDIPVYITKDGKYFVQGAVPLTAEVVDDTTDTPETPTDVPKTDKPKAELFVMTHCPYGTQAEKGFIPAIKSLGDKIDAKIRFVHYFMHGNKEETETYNQLCIREEQSSKYLTYLECFLATDGSASGTQTCLTKAGIDKAKLTACTGTSGKAKEYYAADSKLSQEYGVQGSPTLIVNGVDVSSGRSPDALKTAICSAFNTSPSECSKALSTASPSPGFGTSSASASSDTSGAQCG
jgi:protein-disulfide isomerase